MPTLILHGGDITANTPLNYMFFKTMADAVPEGGLWLGCYFASLAEREAEKYRIDEANLRAQAKHSFHTEIAQSETFREQLERADVLWIAGGSTVELTKNLAIYADLKEMIAHVNVVCGSSAGANILCKNYITKNAGVGQGLGLVPLNVLVHYGHPDYAEAIASARFQGPTLALPETHFAIFEVN